MRHSSAASITLQSCSDISSIRCSTCADGGAQTIVSSKLSQDSTDVEAILRKSSGVCSPSIANSPGWCPPACQNPRRRSVQAVQPGRRRRCVAPCRAAWCALQSADLTCSILTLCSGAVETHYPSTRAFSCSAVPFRRTTLQYSQFTATRRRHPPEGEGLLGVVELLEIGSRFLSKWNCTLMMY